MTAPSTSSHVDEQMPWKLDRGRSFGEMGYLPGLDGLRAVAIIGVLLYHAGIDWMPGGFLGVDVFFVISGFLITSLILEEYDRSGRVNFTKFYLGRARRLLPAVAVLLIAVGLAVLIVYQDALSAFREDALATVFYVNNWWYIFVDQSYFESVGRPPLLKHLWSLSVEEQFYLIWPVFALLLMRSGGRPLVRRLALVLAIASTVWMAVLSIRNGYPVDADPSRAYFGTDSHSMGLLVGAALATMWRPGRLSTQVPRGAQLIITGIGVASLAAVIGFYLFVGEFTPWLYRGGFLALAFFTTALIAAVTHPASFLGPALGTGVLRYIGRRSYGIYLWHWPIFMVTRPGIDVEWSEPVTFVVRIALTLVIAELSYRLVEMPIRRGVLGRAWSAVRSGGALGMRAIATLIATGIVTVVGAAVAIALIMNPGDGRDAIPPDVAEAMGIADGGPLELAIDEESSDAQDDAAANATAGISTESGTDPGITNDDSTDSGEPVLSDEEIRAANGPVSVIGDSVVLGARSAIKDAIPGARVDAKVSRMPGGFTGRVKKLDRRDKLANVVVVHPATNGVINAKIMRGILDPLTDYERVVIVNASVPRSWEKQNNKVIAKVTPDYPNVVVADWKSASDGRSEYFVSDGVHLTDSGAAAFAEVIREASGL
ncbi:MAG: acyltransferase [Actinobacteria bacterium]|nr:acyltransferase [Actinomycetota bacterium]NDG95095.1 acyltransferase [Actinomycetota bacterium]NDH18847.1 acyltransferase [Actinomycetota bacterium]